MKWMRFRIRTNVESEDIIISELADVGLHGAEIEDNVPLTAAEKEQMFTDDLQCADEDETGMDQVAVSLPDADADTAVLSFFIEIGADADKPGNIRFSDGRTPDDVVSDIRGVLDELRTWSDIGEGTISVDVTEDIDWINNWKQYFRAFYIDDILITPSWQEQSPASVSSAAADPDLAPMYTLRIDPGTAFGTGGHESTRLVIRQLRKLSLTGSNVLDIGTGSGILSILSLMMGAVHATGTDLDPGAVPAVADNLSKNGISSDDLELIIGNILDDGSVQKSVGTGEHRYDIITANILPYVLIPLAPLIPGLLADGGVYITSGIIESKESAVREAMENAGLTITGRLQENEWVCLTACAG